MNSRKTVNVQLHLGLHWENAYLATKQEEEELLSKHVNFVNILTNWNAIQIALMVNLNLVLVNVIKAGQVHGAIKVCIVVIN